MGHRLEEIRQHLNSLGIVDPKTKELLTAASHTVSMHNPDNEPTHQYESTAKVFDLPELLEHILRFMDLKTLLIAQQVSHPFFNAIEASPDIRRKMYLQADKGFLSFPPLLPDRCGQHSSMIADLHLQFKTGSNDMRLVVKLWPAAQFPVEVPGARMRRMLICQPPLYKLRVYPNCCSVSSIGRFGAKSGATTIHSKTGITVGQVLDTAFRVREEHKLCAHQKVTWNMHDAEGFVKPDLLFEKAVTVDANDPMRLRLLERQARSVPIIRKKLLLTAYINAKRAGECMFLWVSSLHHR